MVDTVDELVDGVWVVVVVDVEGVVLIVVAVVGGKLNLGTDVVKLPFLHNSLSSLSMSMQRTGDNKRRRSAPQ